MGHVFSVNISTLSFNIYYHHRSAYTQKDIYMVVNKHVKYEIIQFKLKYGLTFYHEIPIDSQFEKVEKKKTSLRKKIISVSSYDGSQANFKTSFY